MQNRGQHAGHWVFMRLPFSRAVNRDPEPLRDPQLELEPQPTGPQVHASPQARGRVSW